MARRSRGRFQSVNIWPAFVDVLSTLLIITIFALLVFMLAQVFLSQTLSGRDSALERLNTRVSELTDLLAMERTANDELRLSVSRLNREIQKSEKRSNELASRADENEDARRQLPVLSVQLEQLRIQLAVLQEALEASEQRTAEQEAAIADLGRRLNAALAEKVQELQRYRSEFFGRLRKVLGERDDIRIVGDRFVFQSEVLFGSASATLEPQGQETLSRIAETILSISAEIPADIDWILRVDGHTDPRPISTPRYKSNWELSSARAISVVEFLIESGVPPERLAAAGFGSFHPIDQGNSEDALMRNRRIELKLDQR